MASGKRQPSKQKRNQQNRQQRAARQARASNAAAAGGSATSSASSAAPAKGGLLGRLRGAPTAQPAAKRPSRATTSAGGGAAPTGRLATSPLANPSLQPPGYRAALTTLVAVAAAVVLSAVTTVPVDGDGDVYTVPAVVAEWADTALQASLAAPDADGAAVAAAVEEWMPNQTEERFPIAMWPISLGLLLPVVGALLLFRAVRTRSAARVVTRAMYATLLGAFLTFGALINFLPAVIAASVAGFQVRKAEMTALREQAAAAQGDDGDVIEADVVDAEVADIDIDADIDAAGAADAEPAGADGDADAGADEEA